jgi:hypothetical protein
MIGPFDALTYLTTPHVARFERAQGEALGLFAWDDRTENLTVDHESSKP